ncbi:perlucin-like protein isoform X2 [Ruditapes philippinarum]|uniref:perlucin-like protein isoform X2 n=1 Tax=Ruditapes philippinarum TaxID=129788 RepID=UPI00295B035A|nr:perlucin-like protein isoform X2 [Ruditapes philippinarum]
MAMNTCFIFVSLVCVFTMVNCRFVLYDSDNTDTIVDNGSQFAAVMKMLATLFSRLNALDGNMTLEMPRNMKCLDGWVTFKDSCYLFDTKTLDFQSAEKECGKFEAHVVRLETQEENTFLKSFMANHFKDTAYWIGMTDVETEGLWKISGTKRIVPFTDWEDGLPNNHGGNEDCVIFYGPSSYSWLDVPCSGKFRAFCGKDNRSLK